MNLEKYPSISNLPAIVRAKGGFHMGCWISSYRCYFGQCFPFITLKSYLEDSDTLSRSGINSISILHVPLERPDLPVMLNWVERQWIVPVYHTGNWHKTFSLIWGWTVSGFRDERSVLYPLSPLDIPKSPVHYKFEQFKLS